MTTILQNYSTQAFGAFCYMSIQTKDATQGSNLAVVRWSGTTKKSNGPAKHKFQWSAGPVTFNFSFFLINTSNICKQKLLNITY